MNRLAAGRGFDTAWRAAAFAVGLGACAAPSAGIEGGSGSDADEVSGAATRAFDLADEPLPIECSSTSPCKAPKLDPLNRPCMPGTCDAGGGNGRGVYVAEDGNYCLGGEESPKFRFCPETFVNRTDGVGMRFRLLEYSDQFISAKLSATLYQGPLSPTVAVTVLGLDVNEGKLRVRYRKPLLPNVFVAEGKQLSNLRFRLIFDPDAPGHPARPPYDMRIEPDDNDDLPSAKDGVYRYFVRFKPANGPESGWRRHCGTTNNLLASSFVNGEVIDGLNADVSTTNALTMSCETGAIDTCLAWGYRPWDTTKTGSTEASSYLFRSCLQAKRAAYFVGLGDARSFTQNGTEILLRDRYGIKQEPIDEENIEALWSPHGAECLGPKLRHEELVPTDPAHALPPCSPVHWSELGWLATGVVDEN